MSTYHKIMEGNKRLALAPAWTPIEAETGWIRIDAPLLVDDTIEPGLVLQVGCYIDRPDCNVTFELRLRRTGGKPAVALERIDWRSQKGGHTIPRRRDLPMAGRRLPETHLHLFDYNHLHENGIMRDGLPVAVKIPLPLQSFEEVREFAGKLFRISNITLVSRPEWRYLLL